MCNEAQSLLQALPASVLWLRLVSPLLANAASLTCCLEASQHAEHSVRYTPTPTDDLGLDLPETFPQLHLLNFNNLYSMSIRLHSWPIT